MVKICVAGCLHGELDKVYADIARAEEAAQFKCDLVLCCGDFQSIRNPADLACMSVPPKYSVMGDFWRYYAEECRAPIPTLFIGGNHESSGYLQELPYGGWVAPNIWYMGYAGVVQFAGLRIAGLSGIYKQHDYAMGHFEHIPFSEQTKRSVYHVRNLEVFRLGQIRRPLDVILSHDWPRGIYHYGDTQSLLRQKPFFSDEIKSDSLGSPPAEQLLCRLRPRYWFSAHLHCSFSALVEFPDSPHDRPQFTRFLALDKCLPKRDYLRFIDIEPIHHPESVEEGDDLYLVKPSSPAPAATDLQPDGDQPADTTGLYLDPEWLCILRSTNEFMSTSQVPCILPGRNAGERCDFSVSTDEIQKLYDLFGGEFGVPDNFERTSKAHNAVNTDQRKLRSLIKEASTKQQVFSNPQTELLCAMLDLVNPNALLLGRASYSLNELSSDMIAKQAEEEEAEDQALDASSIPSDSEPVEPQSETSWLAPTDATEYDPLESVCVAPLEQESAVSHNPEELNLDDIEEEGSFDGTSDQYVSPSATQGNREEPACCSPPSQDDLVGGYSPTAFIPVPSRNAEEIHVSSDSDHETPP